MKANSQTVHVYIFYLLPKSTRMVKPQINFVIVIYNSLKWTNQFSTCNSECHLFFWTSWKFWGQWRRILRYICCVLKQHRNIVIIQGKKFNKNSDFPETENPIEKWKMAVFVVYFLLLECCWIFDCSTNEKFLSDGWIWMTFLSNFVFYKKPLITEWSQLLFCLSKIVKSNGTFVKFFIQRIVKLLKILKIHFFLV